MRQQGMTSIMARACADSKICVRALEAALAVAADAGRNWSHKESRPVDDHELLLPGHGRVALRYAADASTAF